MQTSGNHPGHKERKLRIEEELHRMWSKRQAVPENVTYDKSTTYRGAGPLQYYHFLNTFVGNFRCSQILEFGTHKGGSALAMINQIEGYDRKLVTFDIRHHDLASERLTQEFVEYIVDDPLTAVSSEFISDRFGDKAEMVKKRLMFIDGEKSHSFVSRAINIGLKVFEADYIIIDDINCPEVGKRAIQEQYAGAFIDLCELLGADIRQTGYVDSGFALIVGELVHQ